MARKKRLITPEKASTDEGDGPEPKKPFWKKSDIELVSDRVEDVRSYLDDRTIKVDEDERDEVLRSAASNDPNISNLLDMVPVRRKGLDRDGELLKVPKFSSRFGERMADRLNIKKERGIRLDHYGWAVWDLSDGVRDVREIGTLLSERFGDDVEPLYPRLSKFYAYMIKLELMKILDKNVDNN